jgi:hypothetical protein
MPISPESRHNLHSERASLMRRIEAGKPGVVVLRARLREVTHKLLRKELSDD